MKLAELEPRWIDPNLFVFLCPHCRTQLLSCKNTPMTQKAQRLIFEKEFGEDWDVVPCNPGFCWKISGTMPDLTVTPSINAEASGHWHGTITNGEIR